MAVMRLIPRTTPVERLMDIRVEIEQAQDKVGPIEDRRDHAQLVRHLLRIVGIEVRGDDVRGCVVDVEIPFGRPLSDAADVREGVLATPAWR